jgi:hypothetical protein
LRGLDDEQDHFTASDPDQSERVPGADFPKKLRQLVAITKCAFQTCPSKDRDR